MTDQEFADRMEAREVVAYRLWSSWAKEQALADLERRLRSEAVRHEQHGGHSPSRIAARRRLWAVCGAILVVALAAAVVPQIH